MEPEHNVLVLKYWKFRGMAQPIRHLLEYLDVKYEDRIAECPATFYEKQVCEVKKKCGSNNLPILQDGALMVSQPVAIIKYLCKKFQKVDLIGKNLIDQCQIDEVLAQFMVHRKQMCKVVKQLIICVHNGNETSNEKIAKLAQQLSNTRYWQQLCKTYHEKQWYMGYLTVVDFFSYETAFYYSGFFPDAFNTHEGFRKFKERFQALPAIRAYQQSGRDRQMMFQASAGNLWHGPVKYK